MYKRNCSECNKIINYINIRSFRLAIRLNTKCKICCYNPGQYFYKCPCNKIIEYKRESDYKRAIKYNIKCPNCHKKNYVKNNERKVLKQKSKWNKSNLKYYTDKRKFDINYKIANNLRSRISQALKNNKKCLNTMFLIGCEIDYLMCHIQEQFTEGMTWNNYGRGKNKWNIDHIKPCAKFDLSKKSQQLKCFNYINLQPLWYIENIRKGDKI